MRDERRRVPPPDSSPRVHVQSVFHTAHRERPELLAVLVPAERLRAFAEAVEAAGAVHRVEARAAAGDERCVCRLAEIGRLLGRAYRSSIGHIDRLLHLCCKTAIFF
jgi:hypothetical protein